MSIVRISQPVSIDARSELAEVNSLAVSAIALGA
jgi:hypothetical protein